MASRSLVSTEAGDAQPFRRVCLERFRASHEVQSCQRHESSASRGGRLCIGRPRINGEGSIAGSSQEGKDGSESCPTSQERTSKAADRISRLQSALDFLGHDSQDAELLKASLKTVQEQSRVRPLGERLDSCLQCIERAKERVFRAEARILEAQNDKRLAESQLAQAQQDLVKMKEEASVSDDPPPEQVPRYVPNEEVQRLEGQLSKLEA